MVEGSEKNYSTAGCNTDGFRTKTSTTHSKKKSSSNKNDPQQTSATHSKKKCPSNKNDSEQTNNVKTMKKETRFSCTKVETFPHAGFGKSGSFSGRAKFEELPVGGNTRTRRGIIKPSKEYVRFDDDNYFTDSDQNYQLLLILRIYQCHCRETTFKMEAVTRL